MSGWRSSAHLASKPQWPRFPKKVYDPLPYALTIKTFRKSWAHRYSDATVLRTTFPFSTLKMPTFGAISPWSLNLIGPLAPT